LAADGRAVETFPSWPFGQYRYYEIAGIALPLGKSSMDDWLLENSGLTLSVSSKGYEGNNQFQIGKEPTTEFNATSQLPVLPGFDRTLQGFSGDIVKGWRLKDMY